MSKFLSIDWFKNKVEQAVEKVVSKKIESLMNEEEDIKVEEKPYKNLKLINNVLTVVLSSGDIMSKVNATEQDFNKATLCKTESELIRLFTSDQVLKEKEEREAEIERLKILQAGISTLEKLSDFEVEGNSVKLRGTNRTIPQLLIERFIEIVEKQQYYTGFGNLEKDLQQNDDYQAHKRFFLWCCLNPRAEVADRLYDFLNKNGMKITKQGFFVALRNIVVKHGSAELVDFVSNAYNKVKAVWKKSPDNYTIFFENGEYKLVHNDDLYEKEMVNCYSCDGDGDYWDDENESLEKCSVCDGEGEFEDDVMVNHGEHIGGLTELYLDLPNRHENRFTDNWTKTFDIRIGQVVSMPKEDCNWSTQDCATAGLHFAGHTAPYVLCGDTTVFTLHNPMKVVGIGEEKGRCYEYLPFMTTNIEEADKIMNSRDFDFLQLDEQYAIDELKDLENKVKEGFAVEAKKHDFNIPHISFSEMQNIVKSLESISEEIKDRVKQF